MLLFLYICLLRSRAFNTHTAQHLKGILSLLFTNGRPNNLFAQNCRKLSSII